MSSDQNDLNSNLNFGFDFPEKKIKSSSEEIFFGIKEYLVNFYDTNYDKDIIQDCKNELAFMVITSKSGHRDNPESL